MGEIKKQTLSGVKWTAIERFSIQGVQFVLGIIIARLLTPADYGLIGMLTIFLTISQTLIDSGISTALIRKQDCNDKDFSTAFYYNLTVSILCAAAIFLCSPLIADFFKQPILSPIAKLVSLNLIIGSFGGIQSAKLTISLDFKSIAKVNFISALVSGLVCLGLAYYGWGVWALVWQSIMASVIRVALLWITSKWHPKLIFSRQSFKELFGFGNKIMFASLLHSLYSEMTTIVIGKFYTPAALGDYARGQSISSLPVNIVTDTVGKVTYPILSKIQNDDERLTKVYRHYISLIMMLVVFGVMLLVALAKPLILFLLTEKWAGAIIFLQIYAFAIMFDPICRLNLNLLYVKGRSDIILRLEFIKKIIALAILFAAVPFGVVAICISKVVYTQVAVIANTYYTGKYFSLGYWQQWQDFLPYIGYSLIACLPAYLLSCFCPYHIVSLIAGSLAAVVIYLFILIRFRDHIFMEYCYGYYKNIINRIVRK